MKRQLPGLSQAGHSDESLPEGDYLETIERIKFCWHSEKPFYTVVFRVLEPDSYQSRKFSARLYCTPRALWKLNWFLKDFAYDPALLASDSIEEKAAIGLQGVVRLTYLSRDGRSFANLEAFAPADHWSDEKLKAGATKANAEAPAPNGREVA